MQESTKIIYSAFSGTFYTIPEGDFSLLDMGQLPLLKKPSSSCKKCFGRGHIGRDNQNFHYYLCNCVKKVLDLEAIKSSITNNLELSNLIK
jgi:hypothetical protein